MKYKFLDEGIYFLHISFLEESSKGVVKTGITDQLKLLMTLVFHDPEIAIKIISCDRTLEKISKKKVDFAPALLFSIDEKSYSDGKLGDDEYALKIASREKIAFLPSFFIVSEGKKEEISKKVKSLKYTMNVLSVSDFEI